MGDIRLKTITVEPNQSPLVIQNGNVHIQETKASSSMLSGAMVVNGGVSINSTFEATSITSGGTLTVGGGCSIMRNVYIGQDMTLDSATGIVNVKGITKNRMFIDTTVNKNITFSPDGVNNSIEMNNESISIKNTMVSANSSTGAIITDGGITIKCTVNASSTTSGGGLTVMGGVSANKLLYVGEGINSVFANTIGNIFTTGGSVGIGTTSPNFTLDVNGTGSISSITSSNIHVSGSVSSNNVIATNALFSNETVSNLVSSYGTLGSIMVDNISASSNTFGNIVVTGNVIGVGTMSTFGNMVIKHTSGTLLNVEGSNPLLNVSTDRVSIGTTSGTIIGGLDIAGPCMIRQNISAGRLNVASGGSLTFNSNTIGNLYTTGGNVGINQVNPSVALHITGSGIISANLALTNTVKLLTTTNSPSLSSGALWVAGDSIFSGDNPIFFTAIGNSAGPTLSTRSNGTKIVLNGNIGATTVDHAIGTETGNMWFSTHNINSGYRFYQGGTTASFVISTRGNVGIGTTAPGFSLDIIGNMQCSSNALFSNTQNSSNYTTGGVVLNGGLAINNTTNATSVSNGGGLSCAGGVGITKDVYIGGALTITNTQPSSSSSVGSLIINGGMSVNHTTNATSITNGGSFTVVGGMALAKDMYIGGNVIGTSTNITVNSVMCISTTPSTNLSSGSLIINGGVCITNTGDASSSTNGGSLSVAGGASFRKNVYVGEQLYTYNPVNIQSGTNNSLNLRNSSNITRYSIDLNTSNSNFSLSRYDGSGNLIEKSIEVKESDGIITFYNSTSSTSATSASVILNGGISILSTASATSVSNGGGITVLGGASIRNNVFIGGDVRFQSTTQSNDVSSGSVRIDGGMGVLGNLNVLGNTVLNGNLTVQGTTTTLTSTNTNLNDNVLVLNSGPSGSRDSGILVNRFQSDNDSGTGDVVNDTRSISDTLPLQGSLTSTQIKLSSVASSVDNFYTGWWIKVTSGFSNNQVRKITAYVGSTRTATVSTAWTNQNPSINDVVLLFNKPYVGLMYDELSDKFVFGSTVDDPGNASTSFTDTIALQTFSLSCLSTQSSSNASSGSIVVNGGISIINTTDASSVTLGGTFTTLGGASIGKGLYVGNLLNVNGINMTPNSGDVYSSVTFNGANNQSTMANITSLNFSSSIWGFDVYLAARVVATSSLYTNFHIRGVNKGTSWEIVESYVGDDTGIEFGITTSGQLQYTSPSFPGFSSLQFKWRCFVN